MKKIISFVLAGVLAMGFVACGKGGEESSSGGVVLAPSATVSEPEIPEEPALEVAFLTGLEKGADYPENQRITAVMVNNIAGSRPTSGLSDAKVLVEIVTEGGITRFMALYEDYKKMPQVGSIRSARDQFVQLLIPFWGYLVHDGESTVAKQLLTDYEYDDFDISPKYGADFSWRRNRGNMLSEYTEYTDGEHISAMIERRELSDERTYNSPMFSFFPYNKEPRLPEKTGEEIAIVHSASYRTLFQYDSGSSQYKMSQFSSSTKSVHETVDENNEQQLAFDNVVVLFAPIELYPGSLLSKVDFYGGAGYYFTNGHYETVLWTKGGPQEPLRLLNFDGSEAPVELNPGTTYLAMVDDDNLEAFDKVLTSGTASQEVAAGVGNTKEKETED